MFLTVLRQAYAANPATFSRPNTFGAATTNYINVPMRYRSTHTAAEYNIAKAAEISLAKAMAGDLARDGIRVFSVAPGSTLFPGGSWERRLRDDPEGMAAFIERELPFGRLGTVDEVADTVAFLVSPRASWVVGTCVTIDGGQSRSF